MSPFWFSKNKFWHLLNLSKWALLLFCASPTICRNSSSVNKNCHYEIAIIPACFCLMLLFFSLEHFSSSELILFLPNTVSWAPQCVWVVSMSLQGHRGKCHMWYIYLILYTYWMSYVRNTWRVLQNTMWKIKTVQLEFEEDVTKRSTLRVGVRLFSVLLYLTDVASNWWLRKNKLYD